LAYSVLLPKMIQYSYMIILFFTILGVLFGSFLNAWMWRTRAGKSVLRGRSHCPKCNNALTWKENIPLLSYLWLRGRCLNCQKRISLQYPVVEFVVGFLFGFSAWFHDAQFLLIFRDAYILFFLTFVFVYDVIYQEIWDRMTTYPAFLLLIPTAMFGWHSGMSVTVGVVVGAGFFLLQYLISKGKWIGGGDIRLGMFMGVILGWPLILVALFFAYVGGTLFVLPFLMFGKKKMASRVPFGAYLTLATTVTMYYGTDIVQWYVGLIS